MAMAATPIPGLARASHPGPAIAVTLLAGGTALAAGATAASSVALAAVVLLGQVSIGWSNDAVDAVGDAAAGRRNKPTVAGIVSATLLLRAGVIALLAAAALSYPVLGWVAGLAHIIAVLAAWAYNLRLKDTWASFLPYAIAFGLAPVVVGGALDPRTVPPLWTLWLAGTAAVAVHLANTAPDVATDRAVGRGGVATRLGASRSRLLGTTLLSAALIGALLATPDTMLPDAVAVLAVGHVVVLGAAAVMLAGRWLFPAMAILAVLDAGGLGLWRVVIA